MKNLVNSTLAPAILIGAIALAAALFAGIALMPTAHAQTTGTAGNSAVGTGYGVNNNALSGIGYYAVLNDLFNNGNGLVGNGYNNGGIGNLGAYWAAATLFGNGGTDVGNGTGALNGIGYYAVLNDLFNNGNGNGVIGNGTGLGTYYVTPALYSTTGTGVVNQAIVTTCPYAFTSVMGQGSSGTQVLQLQRFLNSQGIYVGLDSQAGSPGNETTYYGPATANAVARYQQIHNLTVTGTVDAQTLAALNAQCSGNGVVSTNNGGVGNLGAYWAAATLFGNGGTGVGNGTGALNGIGYYAVLNDLFNNGNGLVGNGYNNGGIGNLGAYWAAAQLFGNGGNVGTGITANSAGYGTTGTTGGTGTATGNSGAVNTGTGTMTGTGSNGAATGGSGTSY